MANEQHRHFLQASTWLFATTMAANVCNYVFHSVASRLLGPADYGALVAMLFVITTLVLPGQSLQLILAKRVAVEAVSGRQERTVALGRRVVWNLLTAGGVVCLLLLLFRGPFARFFRMPTTGPVMAVGFSVLTTFLLFSVRGLLQGLQRFTSLGFNLAADGLLRLGLGAGLIFLGGGVSGGLLATTFSSLVMFLLAWLGLRDLARVTPAPARDLALGEFYLASLPIMLSLGAFTCLSALDLIIVKHFFSPEQAGYYAAAAILGKAFLFLPFAAAQVLYPKVCAACAEGHDPRIFLRQSLQLTAGVLVAGAGAAWVMARVIILTLFGNGFMHPETVMLIRCIGWVMTPLALVYLLMHYALALQNRVFIGLLVADVVILPAALVLWHASLGQVLLVAGINHSLLVAAGLGIASWGGIRVHKLAAA